MTGFIHLMTIDNNQIYIDPDTIVSFSEFKFRENDIGLVGTSIVYCIGSVPTSISVRDPIDYVADQIMVGYDNSPDGLPLCKHKDSDLLPQLQDDSTPDGWRELEPEEIPKVGFKFWHDGEWHELHVDSSVPYKCYGTMKIICKIDQKVSKLPALNETLICNKEPDPVLTENLNNFRQAMQETGAKTAQVRSDLALVDTPAQVEQTQEKVLEKLAKIIQDDNL